MQRAIFVGIPGVGKTTVIESVKRKIPDAEIVNFGSVMLEYATKNKIVSHRDELRKLPVWEQRKLQERAARIIARMGGTLLVDTHLFIRTKEGFWPGLPLSVSELLKPTHLILIEAEPEEIAKRREKDRTRYRDIVTLDQIREELFFARVYLASCSEVTGAPMLIVKNNEGRVEDASNIITAVLRGM
jgi:adenylate kinase